MATPKSSTALILLSNDKLLMFIHSRMWRVSFFVTGFACILNLEEVLLSVVRFFYYFVNMTY